MQCPLSLAIHKYEVFFRWLIIGCDSDSLGHMLMSWRTYPSKLVLPFVTENVYFLSPSDKNYLLGGGHRTAINIVKKLHRPKATIKRKKEIDFYHDTESHSRENTNKPEFLNLSRIQGSCFQWHSHCSWGTSWGNQGTVWPIVSGPFFPASCHQAWEGNYRICYSRSPAPKSSYFPPLWCCLHPTWSNKSFWHPRTLQKKPEEESLLTSLLGSKLLFF